MLLHVLIADDDPTTREEFRHVLEQLQCQCVAVRDAHGALGALSAIRFDVLLAGAIPDDTAYGGLMAAARSLQPSLRIVTSRRRGLDAMPPGLVDAYVDLPATLHGLRMALQDAFTVTHARAPRTAKLGH